jgi:hypothetical protein
MPENMEEGQVVERSVVNRASGQGQASRGIRCVCNIPEKRSPDCRWYHRAGIHGQRSVESQSTNKARALVLTADPDSLYIWEFVQW